MGAFFSLCYGLIVYPAFLATFLYAIGFVGNIVVPKSIDTGPTDSLSLSLLVDLLLLSLFAIQHSVSRPAFKRSWTRIVPPAVE